jgi:hypothetical protein
VARCPGTVIVEATHIATLAVLNEERGNLCYVRRVHSMRSMCSFLLQGWCVV